MLTSQSQLQPPLAKNAAATPKLALIILLEMPMKAMTAPERRAYLNVS